MTRRHATTRYPDPKRPLFNGAYMEKSQRDGLEAHGSARNMAQINALREQRGRELELDRLRALLRSGS